MAAFDFEDLFGALIKQESGGRNIQGPLITAGANAGDRAFGPGQLMPKTAADPGFGVKPFDVNAADPVAENMRVSEDYFRAMLNEFGGDQEAGLIAYNAGPGNARKWLDAGRDYAVLPKRSETEPYVSNIFAMAGRGEGAMPQMTPQTSSQGPQSGPAKAPWMTAFEASEEAKSPLGLLLKERMGESEKAMSAADIGTGDKWKEALFNAGIAMLQSKDPNIWNSIGKGLGGAATGLRDLEKKSKSKKKDAKDDLRSIQLKAAKLATPKKGGKDVKFKELMKLVKDEGGGFLDPEQLRSAAVEYGYQIKDDPFGSAYLQNLTKELAAKAQKGEITPEEKADLEALVEIFKDVK